MLIRNKLILRFMALVVGIQLCLTAFVYYYSARARELRFYHRLEAKATQTAQLLIHRLNLDPQLLRSFRKKDLLTMHNERISIYDPQRRLVFSLAQKARNPNFDAQYFDAITHKEPARYREGKVETIGLQYRHQGQTYLIFVAGRDQFGGKEFETLRLILIVGNLGALGLIILAGWYFAQQSLRPLARMVAEVEGIKATSLSRRVDEGNREDEIAQLAMTFNRMLAGLEQAFESQKSFLAHASHELRTPLANLLGTLDTSAAYDTEPTQFRQSLDSALEEIQKIIDLTNGLLALAKADDASIPLSPVAFDDCVLQAISACSAKYPAHPVQLVLAEWPAGVEDAFVVRGNAQLLTTAVLNLLDNALKYSAAPVVVKLGYDTPRRLQLTVADTGLGIPAPDQPRVLEPLYRGQNGRHSPGYGLGLAITSKIVQVHGGQLRLRSAAGEGTTATVLLPTREA